jgi:hypothetical protein
VRRFYESFILSKLLLDRLTRTSIPTFHNWIIPQELETVKTSLQWGLLLGVFDECLHEMIVDTTPPRREGESELLLQPPLLLICCLPSWGSPFDHLLRRQA